MKKTILMGVFVLVGLGITTKSVSAQAVNSWQIGASGMKATTKSAGLFFVVDKNSVGLSTQGGIGSSTHANVMCLNSASSTIGQFFGGISLGNIQAGSLGTYSEVADWSSNVMSWGNGLKVYVSRLSPGIAIQSSSNNVRLFAGTPNMKTYLSPDRRWAVVWWGNSSNITDTKYPMGYDCALRSGDTYKGDIPFLIVFSNTSQPTNVSSGNGGVDLVFGTAPTFSVMPLFGRNILQASTSEAWGNTLPTAIVTKAESVAGYMCSFPQKATESYSYTPTGDVATITENLTYLPICNWGTKLAPVPSFLAMSSSAMSGILSFSGNLVDVGVPTEFGPYKGVINPLNDSYSWSVTGLSRYIDGQRSVGSNSVPSELDQALNSETNKIVSAGHLRPWIFMNDLPRWTGRGDLYWANPADALYHLAEIVPAISNPTTKANLINYMKSERTAYPPEDQYDMSLTTGAVRQSYSYTGDQGSWDYYWTYNSSCPDCQNEAHYTRVPLYNYYGLARYYEVTGDTVPVTVLTKAKNTLDANMKEHDWASGYWFLGNDALYYSRPYPQTVANRHLAGLIGLARISKLAGDVATEQLSRSLVARAMVTKLGMTLYNRFLYDNQIVQSPTDPTWQPKALAGQWWTGVIYNYNWNGALRDARQMYSLDQYGVKLHDNNAFSALDGTGVGQGSLTGYTGLVPETGRMLADTAKADAMVYANVVTDFMPHWYAAYSEAVLGSEQNMFHPLDAFQIFSAKAYIAGETADNLAKYSDISWLDTGDLFYIQKLAEAVKAYKGITWSGASIPTAKSGDANNDSKVDGLDYVIWLTHYNTAGANGPIVGDFNNDSKVDGLDYVVWLNNYGK